jgi:hypothetical protein
MDDTQNWLEVTIKNGENVQVFYHFETWEEMLTEMDECWDNDLYEFHMGGPIVAAKVQPNLGTNETFGFLTRIDGHYMVAMEVPQHHGHALN